MINQLKFAGSLGVSKMNSPFARISDTVIILAVESGGQTLKR